MWWAYYSHLEHALLPKLIASEFVFCTEDGRSVASFVEPLVIIELAENIQLVNRLAYHKCPRLASNLHCKSGL